ncbi:hypothetical protein TCAL_03670 [Tigriopus californicus]|uniref:Innexin n=1 Tax=Tigriopus californicus TaxID=6832 RepID=A0A553N8N9_TIGCA|nr:hypothetical protein TCAL_03670 [Tigriopus californicus]
MAHLLSELITYLEFDEINIDNWYFKLYYKGCVVCFFAGSLVGVLSQYFGQPISCDFRTVHSDMATDYCWIHGSSYIPPEYQPHMKCIVDLQGVTGEDDAPDTSYYQWVVFMQAFQACMFRFPYNLWKFFEGGLIRSFGTDGQAAIMIRASDASRNVDGVVIERVSGRFVNYFKSILHQNQWYFVKYVFCEWLNFGFVFINFWVIDLFLDGKFRYYGVEAVQYSLLSPAEQRVSSNPYCAIFPTEVSCTIPNIGAAGGEQHHNSFCVLAQNIINEKIYFVIWFYLAFLLVVSVGFTVYRICSIFFEPLRFWILFVKIRNDYDDDISEALESVLSRCYIGDWFVLHQLNKNVVVYTTTNLGGCFSAKMASEQASHGQFTKAEIRWLIWYGSVSALVHCFIAAIDAGAGSTLPYIARNVNSDTATLSLQWSVNGAAWMLGSILSSALFKSFIRAPRSKGIEGLPHRNIKFPLNFMKNNYQ